MLNLHLLTIYFVKYATLRLNPQKALCFLAVSGVLDYDFDGVKQLYSVCSYYYTLEQMKNEHIDLM